MGVAVEKAVATRELGLGVMREWVARAVAVRVVAARAVAMVAEGRAAARAVAARAEARVAGVMAQQSLHMRWLAPTRLSPSVLSG